MCLRVFDWNFLIGRWQVGAISIPLSCRVDLFFDEENISLDTKHYQALMVMRYSQIASSSQICFIFILEIFSLPWLLIDLYLYTWISNFTKWKFSWGWILQNEVGFPDEKFLTCIFALFWPHHLSLCLPSFSFNNSSFKTKKEIALSLWSSKMMGILKFLEMKSH